MRKIYLNRNMKKCVCALCAFVVCALPVLAQESPSMDENVDSIKVSYVPGKFWDNWELSVAGGVSVLFDGFRYSKSLMPSGTSYDAVGGVGDITATKWFNPYVAGRIGWMTGYLPYVNPNPASNISYWHNYAHIDVLWDWTTQFGGYKPGRKYDAVPYVHVGVMGNPAWTVMIAGGAGFLNRFHINDSWLINLDLRATATSARKFGLAAGVAIEANALIGVTYRFKERGWKKKMYNPYAPEVRRLTDENKDLLHQLDELRMKNDELARKAAKAQEDKHLKEQVTKEVFSGLPDTLQMSVYYPINSTKLSSYEQAHLRTYLRLIEMNDPEHEHRFVVLGSADKSTGSQATNERLSKERAEAIKQALLANGVKEEQIEVRTEIVPYGDVKMARASHVIMYPLPLKKK